MRYARIEIECPDCRRRIVFYLDTCTDEINLAEVECGICGKKILASLKFEEV